MVCIDTLRIYFRLDINRIIARHFTRKFYWQATHINSNQLHVIHQITAFVISRISPPAICIVLISSSSLHLMS